MKTKEDFTAGDILLFHNDGFLPKAIQFFMKIYGLFRKNVIKRKMFYNHVAVIIEMEMPKGVKKLYIADSAEKGVTVHDDLDKYINSPTVLHLTWKKPLTVKEKELFSKTAIQYSLKGTMYDFINFYDQVRFIITGEWKGKKGEESRKQVYCSEFAAICMDVVRNSFNGETWNKNPLDIELCEDLTPYKNME